MQSDIVLKRCLCPPGKSKSNTHSVLASVQSRKKTGAGASLVHMVVCVWERVLWADANIMTLRSPRSGAGISLLAP